MKQINMMRLSRRFGWFTGMTLSLITISLMVGTILFAAPVSKKQIPLAAFDYPPYMDESLPEKGLFCELVAAAYRSLGYTVSFEFYPGKRATQNVVEGEVLASLGSERNYSEDARKNDVLQSVRVFYFRTVGFYLKDRFKSISFKTLKDLQGYRIGIIRGASASILFNKYPELNLDIEEVTTMKQMFKKVYAKRNDLGFTVELSGRMFFAKHYPNEKDRWAMTEDAMQGIFGDVVFSKKYPDGEKYLNIFKNGLQQIRDNGTYLHILEKYYGVGKVPAWVTDVTQQPYDIPKE